VTLIHAGRLAAIGTISEVKRVFDGRPIVEVRTPRATDAMQMLDAMPAVEKTSLFGTAVHAVLKNAAVPPAGIADQLKARGIPVESIDLVEPSLEDVFLDVVERAEAQRAVAS